MKKKALIVNDSRFESIILRDILERIQYDVEIADEFNCMEKIKRFDPDVVIVNLVMQKINGDELISLIKKDNTKIKCLISSCKKISLDDFKNKSIIDGIIKTPTNKDKMKQILENTLKKVCTKCGQIMEQSFIVCPYCGDKL